VHTYTDLIGFMAVWRDVVQRETGHGDRVGGHADIAESSVMAALHPALVHAHLAEPGFQPELTDEVVARIISGGFRTVTPNGILGDARGLSATLGEHCIAALADMLAQRFRASIDQPATV
jgi:creatinine amidohydrolase